MATQVISDADIIQEASEILLQHMSPSKVVRFFASWRAGQAGQGDYLAWRDEEFAEETVDSLSEKIFAFQETQHENRGNE